MDAKKRENGSYLKIPRPEIIHNTELRFEEINKGVFNKENEFHFIFHCWA